MQSNGNFNLTLMKITQLADNDFLIQDLPVPGYKTLHTARMFGQRLASAERGDGKSHPMVLIPTGGPVFRHVEKTARAALADWQASQKAAEAVALPAPASPIIPKARQIGMSKMMTVEPDSHDLLNRLLELKAEKDSHHLIGMLCEKLAVAMDCHPDVKEAVINHINRLSK